MFVLKGKYTKSYPYLRPLGLLGNIRLNISSISSFAWNSLRVLLGREEQRISAISSIAKNSSTSCPLPPFPPALCPPSEDMTQLFFHFFVCVEFFASSRRTWRKNHFFAFFICDEFFDFWTPPPNSGPLASLGTFDPIFLQFLRLRGILCEFSSNVKKN